MQLVGLANTLISTVDALKISLTINSIEHTIGQVSCVYTLSTCRPLCNTCIHLVIVLNILMPNYSYAQLSAKCHEVTLMANY